MIFKPAQLGMAKLDPQELEADKKACRKIGPCGVGKKALYLNSFYIDRRYYLPYGSITRVFKRVAMSSGGFSGKGVFASMAYLVVEYDGGKHKQCNFKDERDVDALLAVLAKEQPQLHLLSAAGEQALEKKAAEKAARKLPELSEDAQHSLTVLRRAKEYLDAKPELSAELSAAQRRKRAQLQSKPVYRYVALAIFVLGVAAAAYGLYSVFSHTGAWHCICAVLCRYPDCHFTILCCKKISKHMAFCRFSRCTSAICSFYIFHLCLRRFYCCTDFSKQRLLPFYPDSCNYCSILSFSQLRKRLLSRKKTGWTPCIFPAV